MMRIVFLLFAEESGLLPADSELYARAYSAGGLYAELEQRVADARGNEGELEHTFLAWHRLLALFTVAYRGVDHPELDLIAHDGSLFDPDGHAWLEGRVAGDSAPGTPLAVDDRTVLHMLRAVQTVTIGGELRTVSFRTLTVEQIGYVYEGLLSFEGFRAAAVVVGLTGKDGREEEVWLPELEGLAAAHPGADALAVHLAEAYKASGLGSPRALTAKLGPLAAEEQAQAQARLYAVTRDHDLVRRLLPFYRIIRQDLRGDPVVILPGALYVTESALRASTGTHYTPRFLAEQVAEGALEPLVYLPGPLQTAQRSEWKLRSPREILDLKVEDLAMGSGAFLVAACRYLAGKLIEAWSAEGDARAREHLAAPVADSGLALDSLADPLVIDARRQVIEHCLYGADINPMAVEMAKLSLWLVSMDPRRPFTFLDDRLVAGDSLLGITSIEQLEWMHLNLREGRALHEGTVLDFMAGVRTVLAEAAEERLGLVSISGDDMESVTKKRQILAAVGTRTAELTRYANLIAGAALVGPRKGSRGGTRESEDETQSGRQNLWLIAAKTAHEAATRDATEKVERLAAGWLATDQPDDGFDRVPLHWPLVFPEVFDSSRPGGPGFDAVIGNPPFLGGLKLKTALGQAYNIDVPGHSGAVVLSGVIEESLTASGRVPATIAERIFALFAFFELPEYPVSVFLEVLVPPGNRVGEYARCGPQPDRVDRPGGCGEIRVMSAVAGDELGAGSLVSEFAVPEFREIKQGVADGGVLEVDHPDPAPIRIGVKVPPAEVAVQQAVFLAQVRVAQAGYLVMETADAVGEVGVEEGHLGGLFEDEGI